MTRNGKTVAKTVNPNVRAVDSISRDGLFYLVRRSLHSTDLTYKAVGSVLDIVKVLTVTNDDVLEAFVPEASDFEDCLLAVCAKANKCDAIVTRNKKDFSSFGITLLSPDEQLEMMA